MNGLSYNQVVEKVVNSSDDSESNLLRNFLDLNASQLTPQGIAELLSDLDNDGIAVLFRNNHFQTLSKHEDLLYVLVTDMGFLGESSVVWETLDSVDGSSTFVDAAYHMPTIPDHSTNESTE
ncbi:unnamed protein product [Gongylonema pulchrum]|uniref:Ubiquitin carboxyl-terminal hydrolase n=1 Tax=Gongylonema pulchrum TaxID=637853 RepID=A0A183DLC9_9BILA|nr:unnamed protein product [Gongylonema pulchrum]